MSQAWDDKFSNWASPPGQAEQDRCDNAVRAVRAAVSANSALSAIKAISIFSQGSYRNRTNVHAESDVDICVCCADSVFFDLPAGTTAAQFNLTVPAPYTFVQFRADVGAALVAYFGTSSVSSGSKAFDIHENTYRIAADVVPVFEYRHYAQLGAPPVVGTGFLSGDRRIINYPEQHYSNGVTKNDETGRRFKAFARILKRLRCEMMDAGRESARGIQSFAIESMVWNVPSPLFGQPELTADLRSAIAHLWTGTKTDNECSNWKEVNGIKPLFHTSQAWTRDQAHTFLLDAWSFAELG
jgi:hypothetical protein